MNLLTLAKTKIYVLTSLANTQNWEYLGRLYCNQKIRKYAKTMLGSLILGSPHFYANTKVCILKNTAIMYLMPRNLLNKLLFIQQCPCKVL